MSLGNFFRATAAGTFVTTALFVGIYYVIAAFHHPPWGEPVELSRFREMTMWIWILAIYVAPIAAVVSIVALAVRGTVLGNFPKWKAAFVGTLLITALGLAGGELLYQFVWGITTILHQEWLQFAFLTAVPTLTSILFLSSRRSDDAPPRRAFSAA